MGDIAPVAAAALEQDGFEAAAVPFEQNLYRDESGYRRELLKAVDALRPDVILPVGNTVAISRIKASVAGLPPIIVDTPEKVELLDGKISASQLASQLGIPQPRIFGSYDDITRYPVIFKRDRSFAGSGVYKPSSREALEKISEHFEGKPRLVEEYVEGSDWSVDAVRLEGFFRCGCYRTLESKGQGPSKAREAAEFPLLGRFAQQMLDAIDYHGVCGFDFRVTADGNPYFLECNPRLTGGLSTQIEAGFDIPGILVKS